MKKNSRFRKTIGTFNRSSTFSFSRAAGVIRGQIAAREEAYVLEEEAKEQEARAMRKKQELLEEEDIQVIIMN